MHGFSPGEVSMERTHCGLYQAAATEDCEDIMASGKPLKLTRMFHVGTNPPGGQNRVSSEKHHQSGGLRAESRP